MGNAVECDVYREACSNCVATVLTARGSGRQQLSTVDAAPVCLSVYDLGTSIAVSGVNDALRLLGTGLFHIGVDVYNKEWSYAVEVTEHGTIASGVTGVFWCVPRTCTGYSFRESVPLGCTYLSEDQVDQLMERLSRAWVTEEYNVLSRNCCHFAQELCYMLGVGSIPGWTTNMSEALKPSFEHSWQVPVISCFGSVNGSRSETERRLQQEQRGQQQQQQQMFTRAAAAAAARAPRIEEAGAPASGLWARGAACL